MDEIEKWLVDQAATFTNPGHQDAVRIVATKWHNLALAERLAVIRGQVAQDPDRTKGQSERLADVEAGLAHLTERVAVLEGTPS